MFYRQHKPKSYALIAIRLLLKLYLKVFPIRRSQTAQAPVNRKPKPKRILPSPPTIRLRRCRALPEFRQLGDVSGDAPRVIFGEQAAATTDGALPGGVFWISAAPRDASEPDLSRERSLGGASGASKLLQLRVTPYCLPRLFSWFLL